MAYQIDSISIRGLRKSHLLQLAGYIRERDRDGYYYGNRSQFEARHEDLLELAERLEEIYSDKNIRIARG